MKKIVLTTILFVFLITSSASAEIEGHRTIVKVLDGDTVVLDGGEQVRLIGVDTPELHFNIKPLESYAKEAYEFVRDICEGKDVIVEYDIGNSHNNHLDKHKRTLAYLYLTDGTFINEEIVRQGYGYCDARSPFEHIDKFREYQKHAMDEGRGLWWRAIRSRDLRRLILKYGKLDDSAKDHLRNLAVKD